MNPQPHGPSSASSASPASPATSAARPPATELTGVALAIGALVACALVAALIPWATLVGHQGLRGLVDLFHQGGWWLWLLLLLALAQLTLGLALGIVGLWRPLPGLVYLAAPVVLLVVGLGATAAGQATVSAALAFAAPEMRLPLLLAGTAEARTPLAFALLHAASGGLLLAAAMSCAAFVRRQAPGAARHAPALQALGVAGAAALAGGAAAVLLIGSPGWHAGLALRLAALGLAIGLPAVAAGGVAALAGRASLLAPGLAGGLALGLAIGLGLPGLALAELDLYQGLSALATIDPAMRAALLTQFQAASNAQLPASAVLAACGALAAGVPLAASARLWPAWLARHGVLAAAGAGLLLACALGALALDRQGLAQRRAVLAGLALPRGLELPGARGTPFALDRPIVALHEHQLWLSAEPLGPVRDPATLALLARRLRDEPVEPGSAPTTRAEPATGRQPYLTSGPEPDRANLAIAAAPGVLCRASSWPPFALALPRTLAGAELRELVAALQAAGACHVSLLARPGAGEIDNWQQLYDHTARRRVDHRAASLADLMAAATIDWRGLEVVLLPDLPPPDPQREAPALDLVLWTRAGATQLTGAGGSLVQLPAAGPDQLDLEALVAQLRAVRDRFPEEGRLALVPDAALGAAALVELAGTLAGPAPDKAGAPLFQELLIVTHDNPRRALAQLDPPADHGSPAANPASPPAASLRGTLLGVAGQRLAPPLVEGALQVRGPLEREVIRQVVRRHQVQVRYCYERELQRLPELGGKLTLRFTIGADGSVLLAEAEADNAALAGSEVGACLAARARSWRFPAHPGPPVEVRYPFILRPH